MAFVPLAQRLSGNAIPLVLAGPILRHVAADQVTVFVALREARTVTLKVYAGTGGIRTTVFEGSRATVPLGSSLHVVAVTAASSPPVAKLVPETTYYYDLDLGGGLTLASAGVLALAATTNPLALPGADLPSFSLAPAALDQVRLVHASCRKPHGESIDALTALDDMIAEAGTDATTPAFARARPHQLFLTGDQIYADDVADVLLYLLVDAASALLGWQETLPGSNAALLTPGARASLTLAAGLTSGIPTAGYPKSHLMRFGEFAAMYLFAWSPVLWPADLPTDADVGTATNLTALGRERARIASFRTTLPVVRRVLANVPTYMVFDDHEITDDWYMNRRWVGPEQAARRPTGGLLDKPLGRRVVQNGLLAYALFQAWGSTPEQFAATGTAGEPGRALLAAATSWRGTSGDAHDTAIATRVGLPPAALAANATALTRPAGALRWHYRVAPAGGRYEVLALDCRTARAYPVGADTRAAGLLSTAAIAEQVTNQPDDPNLRVTIVIAQTPVLGLPFIEDKQRAATGDDVWANDVEAWSLNEDAYQRLLGALAIRRRRVVVLSGDVHYTFAARMTYWATRPYGQAQQAAPIAAAIVQMNSSALKNQTSDALFADTIRLHTGGYNQFFVQNVGRRLDLVCWATPQTSNLEVGGGGRPISASRWPPGWNGTPAVVDLARMPSGSHVAVQPEWRYRVEYLRGEKPAPGQDTPMPTLTNLPADAAARTTAVAGVHAAYNANLRNDEGRDIVGRNNVGELRIELDGAGVPLRVVQRSWWRFRDEVTPEATTTFTVGLDPATPTAPGPLP
ncbi:hypothetical protein [Phytohabitans rumicis]|uniref:PhoD-like phosphatase metallophosphatase domain-containing protein n=1 Tax=Phytohabitans rumicis TaxID=1076125 RepID=A0A6V8KNC1_9ACTN|nr:hypothetical protein [Phytohabitans rumicis]GFJ86662.1 hypothetical protein Prum_003040 [Phytohabitans rumicis]